MGDQKSDRCIVAMRPVKTGGAKAATNNRFCCGSSTMPQEGIGNGKGSGRNKVPVRR